MKSLSWDTNITPGKISRPVCSYKYTSLIKTLSCVEREREREIQKQISHRLARGVRLLGASPVPVTGPELSSPQLTTALTVNLLLLQLSENGGFQTLQAKGKHLL